MSYLDDLFINDVKHSGSPAGGGSGGVSSWNDLTDKPFYETESILSETQDSKQLKYIGYVVDGLHYYHNNSFLKIEFNDEYYIYEIDAANGIPSGAIELTGQLNSDNTVTFNVYVERFGTPNGRYVTVNSDVIPKSIKYCQRTVRVIDEKYMPDVFVRFDSNEDEEWTSNKTLSTILNELNGRPASSLKVIIGDLYGRDYPNVACHPIKVICNTTKLEVYYLRTLTDSVLGMEVLRLIELTLGETGYSVTETEHVPIRPN